jgi:hypothetical protein
MCAVLLPSGVKLIAVNKYNISYIISYHIYVLFTNTLHVSVQKSIIRLCTKYFKGYLKGNIHTRMGEGRSVYRGWWENLMERYHWGDPGVDGGIMLRYIFKK